MGDEDEPECFVLVLGRCIGVSDDWVFSVIFEPV
jgi:hypothetical protein